MSAVYSGGAEVAAFTYSGEGHRIRKDSYTNGTYEEYVWGPQGVLSEHLSTGAWVDYIYGGASKIAKVTNSGTTYYLTDQVGTTDMAFANDGSLAWQDFYSPFGQELTVPTTTTSYKFTGKERDQESSLDNFEARYYGSSMGRFMSPDPGWFLQANLGNPQTWNQYSYGLNNPLINTDPTGKTCQTNSTDGATYDDMDGKGCDVVDQQNADRLKNGQYDATVTAPPMSAQEIANLGISLEMDSTTPMPQMPKPKKPKGRRLLPRPADAMNCTTSTGVTFAAPPDFNVSLPYKKGEDDGILGSGDNVGQGGTFDYQRPSSDVFIGSYTPVANIAVGAYQYGAGEPAWVGSAVSNGYALVKSGNGPTAQQAQFRQLGRDLASGKATYSCQHH